MEITTGPSLALKEIADLLDSLTNCMIFECPAPIGTENPFERITLKLSEIKAGIVSHQVRYSRNRKRILLIVRIDPDHTETITQSMLNTTLQKRMTMYVYTNPC